MTDETKNLAHAFSWLHDMIELAEHEGDSVQSKAANNVLACLKHSTDDKLAMAVKALLDRDLIARAINHDAFREGDVGGLRYNARRSALMAADRVIVTLRDTLAALREG